MTLQGLSHTYILNTLRRWIEHCGNPQRPSGCKWVATSPLCVPSFRTAHSGAHTPALAGAQCLPPLERLWGVSCCAYCNQNKRPLGPQFPAACSSKPTWASGTLHRPELKSLGCRCSVTEPCSVPVQGALALYHPLGHAACCTVQGTSRGSDPHPAGIKTSCSISSLGRGAHTALC